MEFEKLIINSENKSNFFYKMNVGDVFQYEPTEFLWEDIYSIAISQGKKIKEIEPTNILYNILGANSGVIIRDIKEAAENIRDEEILRLQSELSSCYKRVDSLEIQLGIRGSERLDRCEICKKHILPYQSWINTETEGKAHIECELNKTIDELEKSNRKKDETIRKWSKDAQRFGSENQSLRIERDTARDTIKKLQDEINILTGMVDNYKKNEREMLHIRESLEKDVVNQALELKELSNINDAYENLLRNLLVLIIRVLKLLGDNTGADFKPIPVIHLSGEQRMELNGWCKPLYDELYECMNQIKEVL